MATSKKNPGDPPQKVIQTILDRGHWEHFRTVTGLINSPTMRPDSTILEEPGYDEAAQLLYQPSEEIVLPEIPDKPSKKDAETALKLLEDLLSECAFVGDVDK